VCERYIQLKRMNNFEMYEIDPISDLLMINLVIVLAYLKHIRFLSQIGLHHIKCMLKLHNSKG